MNSIISSKLREFALELRDLCHSKTSAAAIQNRKTEMLGEIYNILALALGEPVKTFQYAFKDKNGKQVGKLKTYTPQSFRDEVIGHKLSGTFIMAMNDPRHEYYKTCLLYTSDAADEAGMV